VYGGLVRIREYGYSTGLLRSSRFDIPVISVGNLSMGGSGKSPHIEYLIRLLEPYVEVAVLSRGYKRKTEGFRLVEPHNTALEVGDEPAQFKNKFPNTVVAVAERRAYAIPQMLYRHPHIQVILLDDAFQHLAVRPYFSVILTEYARPFFKDYLVPSGQLREWRSGYRRAHIIIVTKCPMTMTLAERQDFINHIQPLPHQSVYFSYYRYSAPYAIRTPSVVFDLSHDTAVLLVTGIAHTDYLISYLSAQCQSVTSLAFEDHRLFTNYDMAQIKTLFEGIDARRKIILTTEKDATRLLLHEAYLIEQGLEIYALPVEVAFLFEETYTFDDHIKRMLLDFKI
jgi:tetraacyldisaccharide 4'-kinase